MRAIDLARRIINIGIRNGTPVSNLHLQKILYFVNLIFLQNNRLFLVDRTSFEAWMHGPVNPETYYQYSVYGGTPIHTQEVETPFSMTNENGMPLSDEENENVNQTILELIRINPWVLVDYSHRVGGAWERTYNQRPFGAISPEFILQEAGVQNARG